MFLSDRTELADGMDDLAMQNVSLSGAEDPRRRKSQLPTSKGYMLYYISRTTPSYEHVHISCQPDSATDALRPKYWPRFRPADTNITDE